MTNTAVGFTTFTLRPVIYRILHNINKSKLISQLTEILCQCQKGKTTPFLAEQQQGQQKLITLDCLLKSKSGQKSFDVDLQGGDKH